MRLNRPATVTNAGIARTHGKLTATFGSSTRTTDETDNVQEAMELIVPLRENEMAQESPAVPCLHAVLRLTMHSAYKWDKLLPWVEDHQFTLAFLDHRFDSATRGG